MVSDNAAVADADALSVTRTVKLLGPAGPPVPDMVPAAARLNPAGNVPLATAHEYGGEPPVAPSAWEYATPTVPAGSDDVVIPKAGELMVIDNAAVADADALSVTRTVKLLDPAVPGGADMVPPAASLTPPANVPVAPVHEYGGDPPVAPSPWEYATPPVPAGSDDVVMPKAGE